MLTQMDKVGDVKLAKNYTVVGGVTNKPMPGSASQYLWLVAQGLIVGGDGQFWLTPEGDEIVHGEKNKNGKP